MATVADHYADHLGPVYSWMAGGMDAALARGGAELDALSLPSTRPGAATAFDLGAGFGMHAIPLARRGYKVIALDSDAALLEELTLFAAAPPIRTVNADLLEFRSKAGTSADVILCMGDTLTHLAGHAGVEALFKDVAATLNPGGIFAATFRDYASAPLMGDARFIPVRCDERRLLTCYLEYADSTVMVHDLLHEHDGRQWRLRVSSYPKLRLSPQWVVEKLGSLGLAVSRDSTPGGMIRIRAVSP